MYGMGFGQYSYKSFTFKILRLFLFVHMASYNHPEYSPKKRSISMGNLGRMPPLPYLNCRNRFGILPWPDASASVLARALAVFCIQKTLL